MTRQPIACLLIFMAACSGGAFDAPDAGGTASDAPDASGETRFSGACAAEACAPAATVASAAELAARIVASDWTVFGPYTTGCLPASDDLGVAAAITLRSTDVAVPASCTGRSDCRQQVMFRLRGAPAGVTCLDPETWFDGTLCAGIAVAGATTVRVRALTVDIHPSMFGNFAPIVEILAACATPCGEGELACPATHTCWPSARDLCAYCLGGDNEQCACQGDSGPLDEGTSCSYFVSGDIVLSGTCHAATCVAP